MDIKDRIKQYIEYKGISDYRFEKELSLSKGYINKVKNPTSDILIKMCGIYTDISTDWLLRGEGEMLKHNHFPKGINASYRGNFSEPINTVIGNTISGSENQIGNTYMKVPKSKKQTPCLDTNNEDSDKQQYLTLQKEYTILQEKYDTLKEINNQLHKSLIDEKERLIKTLLENRK